MTQISRIGMVVGAELDEVGCSQAIFLICVIGEICGLTLPMGRPEDFAGSQQIAKALVFNAKEGLEI